MHTKSTIVILFFFGFARIANAQDTRFMRQGVIEFERSINMYAVLDRIVKNDGSISRREQFESYKKNQPQFRTLLSSLSFSNGKTLFKPIYNEQPRLMMYEDYPEFTQINTVYTDLVNHQRVTQKKVYDQLFLLKDSTRTIKWKLTGETREIAGYECQRANAIIMDSVYVVAFYTEKIPVSGGPESFCGLPGMILGVALPHDHVTWFAKIIIDKSITGNEVTEPKIGRGITFAELIPKLKSALKTYGNYASEMLKSFLL
ncbi:GLPGLI family protein [Pedobacter sp. MC2016-15]|uniref:GLPGLI family protein n=1 Tax=Pedobacter sp. MC2016-15 TaxID=2994473 RepID=UPI00224786C9|nr:GLPGLI family protein [Pedobacter sp. MC2016-15]MCX2479739.1 GLPGLI family protein [Pedobacter sp. MC2016-15]